MQFSRMQSAGLKAVVLFGLWTSAVFGAESSQQGSSVFDQVWRYADIYKSEDNPVVQRVSFTGRFQLDYAWVDADQGDHDEWNIRRFRLGTKAKLFKDFTLHVEGDFNPQEPDPFYSRLTDVYLAWSRSPDLEVTVGKQSAPFTLEGSTSSKELLTIDRSNLANNLWFPNEYFPGVSLAGHVESWRYQEALYTAGASNGEFGEFNGGVLALGTIGYDFAKRLNSERSLLSLNYVYNEPDEDSSWTRPLQHIGSVNFECSSLSTVSMILPIRLLRSYQRKH